jgi:hypothetical protein
MITQSRLWFRNTLVGEVIDPFLSEGTWSGTFRPLLDLEKSNPETERIARYVSFSENWNERERMGESPDPKEFDEFADVLNSNAWMAIGKDGQSDLVTGGPIFFPGGTVSWRVD